MNKNVIPQLLAGLSLCCLGSSVQGQIFSDDFESYGNGTDLTSAAARANGWYTNNSTAGVNDATVTDAFNSPFSAGSQGVLLRRTSTSDARPEMRNYFGDEPSIGGGVTGSVGANLSGTNLGFSWDWNRNTNPNPDFRITDTDGVSAIRLLVWAGSSNQLRYGDGSNPDISSFEFAEDTWYRFELSNVNTTANTYDIAAYEFGNGTPVLLDSAVPFNEASIASLNYWSLTSNTASNHTFDVDNFAIVPEPSTYAAVMGFLVMGVVVLRRSRRA